MADRNALHPPSVELEARTGNTRVDAALLGLVGLYEAALPGRIRCYYLLGSWARGDALPSSDVDFALVFRDSLGDAEEGRARLVRRYASLLSGIFLDPTFHVDDLLLERGDEPLRTASVFLFGEDLRDRLPVPDVDRSVRRAMHTPFTFSARMREADVLEPPLDAPDPSGELLGYDEVRWFPEGHPDRHTLRDFVATVGFIASAFVALNGREIVVRKSDVATLYRKRVDDEWSDLVEYVFDTCRAAWAWRPPEAGAERDRLRRMCQRALEFENHFFARYHDFLVEELHAERNLSNPALLQRVGEVVYASEVMLGALGPYVASGNETIRELAERAVGAIQRRL